MKISESSRVRVWVSITLMVAVYVASVYWVYRESAGASSSIARLVPLATALAAVPLLLVTILAIFSMLAKFFRYMAWKRAAHISPEIRETLADVVTGAGDRERLGRLARDYPGPFEVVFSEFLSSFAGQTNAVLRDLAVELGLVSRWRRATRSRNLLLQKTALANLGRVGQPIDLSLLRQPVEQTRIEAACAWLASGSPEAPAQVFKMLPEQSTLGRIRLSDSLLPFAIEICGQYLADGIRSGDARRAKASLDLLRAWERWIPIDGFPQLVAGRELDVRLAALPALKYASRSEQEAEQEIVTLLEFPDERAHAPAAKAASELCIEASIPLLLSQLRTGGPSAALAAAQALADIGPQGRDLLETEIVSSARPQYALQALEHALVVERV